MSVDAGGERRGAGAAASGWTPGARELLALAVMWAAVLAVYLPVAEGPGDNTLLGADYYRLHERRIRFAREALFGEKPHLPDWYPRELFGTPFRANVQNFPFLPTRLVLLAFDPLDAYGVGVNLAAVLAATFAYGYGRSVGLGRAAAAAAGWTFAAAGFFAARVMVGHLPLLEAYPALPLLLWLIEIVLAPGAAQQPVPPADAARTVETPASRVALRWMPARLIGLGLATCCVVLAGHPQLPLYAVATAGLYLLYRGRRLGRRTLAAAAAMILGAGCAAFALVPMALLVGRSTRVLALEHAANDIAFPYGRLLAWAAPWKDGWPPDVARATYVPFTGYPTDAYFWDTVCYEGIAPLLALALLAARALIRRRGPAGPWLFITVAGIVALATALPVVQNLMAKLPGTLVRSPSRQVYVTTFALAMALGAAVEVALRAGPRWKAPPAAAVAVAVALAAHFVDLWSHGRSFVRMVQFDRARDTPLERQVAAAAAGGGRVAVDYALPLPFNRAYDDVGFFDSVMLARPYAALLDLAGAREGLNVQDLDASALNPRALRAAGARLVVTTHARQDLPPLGGNEDFRVYAVPDPLPRATFFPSGSALFLDREETRRRLRDASHDLRVNVMVPPGDYALGPAEAGPAATGPAPAVDYRRDRSDAFTVDVRTEHPGILRVLESWDPGWRATVDGRVSLPVPADDAFLAVPLGPGTHRVVFEYSTPGLAAGAVVSLASTVTLFALAWGARRRRSPVTPGDDQRGPGATRALV